MLLVELLQILMSFSPHVRSIQHLGGIPWGLPQHFIENYFGVVLGRIWVHEAIQMLVLLTSLQGVVGEPEPSWVHQSCCCRAHVSSRWDCHWRGHWESSNARSCLVQNRNVPERLSLSFQSYPLLTLKLVTGVPAMDWISHCILALIICWISYIRIVLLNLHIRWKHLDGPKMIFVIGNTRWISYRYIVWPCLLYDAVCEHRPTSRDWAHHASVRVSLSLTAM